MPEAGAISDFAAAAAEAAAADQAAKAAADRLALAARRARAEGGATLAGLADLSGISASQIGRLTRRGEQIAGVATGEGLRGPGRPRAIRTA